jgi:hypothetical protein
LGGGVVDLMQFFFEMFTILPQSSEKNIRKNGNIFIIKRALSSTIYFLHPLVDEYTLVSLTEPHKSPPGQPRNEAQE